MHAGKRVLLRYPPEPRKCESLRAINSHIQLLMQISSYRTLRGSRLFVLVKRCQVSIDVFFLEVIGGREPEFGGLAAADANLLRLPQPVFQLHTLYRRNVYG